jgi:hypothetical protein
MSGTDGVVGASYCDPGFGVNSMSTSVRSAANAKVNTKQMNNNFFISSPF